MENVSANGAEIPVIGLGTWRLRGEECARIVSEALRLGYRHVDTAQMYENEQAVGEGLRTSGVPRDEVFVTTKIWFDCLAPGLLERTAEDRLKLLGLDDVDLMLVHWPTREVALADTMASLAKVRRAGLARHIGVANFTVPLLEEAVAACPEPLVANQVEYHPRLDQSAVLAACRRLGISLTAYRPLGAGGLLDEPLITETASRYRRSPSQILLRWLVQQEGVAAIPKTSTPERLAENIDVFSFELSAPDMKAISGLAEPDGRGVDPSWAPAWDAA